LVGLLRGLVGRQEIKFLGREVAGPVLLNWNGTRDAR
jgi:hypothetical protein